MPSIITSVHNPIALAATCRRLNVAPPKEGCFHLDDREAAGWIVRLPGVRFPIVCDTLTGLIAYHPADNAFYPYRSIMKFVYRVHDFQAQLRRGHHHPVASRAVAQRPRRRLLVGMCR